VGRRVPARLRVARRAVLGLWQNRESMAELGSDGAVEQDVRIESLGEEIGIVSSEIKPRGWFTRLARRYLAKRVASE